MKCVFARRKPSGFVMLALLLAIYLAYNQTGDLTNHAVTRAPTYRNSTDSFRVEEVILTRAIQNRSVIRSLYYAPVGQRPTNQKYHRHWDVNCSGLFAGNGTVIKNVSEEIRQERQKESLMPSDSTVVTWTDECALFTRQRGYPTIPNSEEEASFPLAYIIVIHKGSAQVERLLRAIYQPQNIYCLHPDSKSSKEFHQAMDGLANCFANVFIASKLEDVQYPGLTLLLSNINCMRDLTEQPASGYQWRYVMNLCGQDFPLKTNLEIVRQLKAYNGHNGIRSIVPNNLEKRNRTQFQFIVRNGTVIKTESRMSPAPHQLKVYTGSSYYAVKRDFVNYILRDSVATDLLHWTRNTKMPDETYWATLQRAPGVPGGVPQAPELIRPLNIRYVNWYSSRPHTCRGTFVREVCILTIGDLHYVRKQPHLFANKFYYQDDPVTLQCLETVLDFRVRHPEESTKLPGFPVQYPD
ncbi:beta-1,3-galactosyl-O-glycosyl-glycoprotein beta-1,6-N-acetylglucosaminyltransferase 4-like [Patiria miniata]|uniref:Beta-1,3-galactosyl-O-glycosyl-glycoprotein beta-1,6-N-acetylglucosaminyltransferase n=1 Tax=Patiria miniata TaxID=46514 RepID=A0A914BT66_PATMI|nr:beta-1,3-galactosyl-O-glycosyl-glycoprotein beta-1,6-N-acetylglucosaminyltransferase 4-like [Patiria miniata]